MRAMLIAGVCLVGLSGGALAQDRVVVRGPGAGYPVPGASIQAPPAPSPRTMVTAPYVGMVVPPALRPVDRYMFDWASYDLPQPPVGYNWLRYAHNTAVLIDERGVAREVREVDLGRYAQDRYYAEAPDYPPPPPQGNLDPRLYQRRDNGLGGAAIGAIAGGALGAAVAGRGDRLGGALIGGGVGAITGYAVDRAEDRGRVPPPPPPYGYGAGYPPPPPVYDGYVGGYRAPTVQTYTVPAGGSQVIYAGPGVTTVTVTTQPSVATTTTTTEYHDEVVTYSHPAAKRVYRRPVHRSKYKAR